MTRGPCPAARLRRALDASARAAGTSLEIAAHRTMPWHSATFAGDRHELEGSAVSGERLDRWLAGIPDLDVAMPGQLLAGLSLARCDRTAAVTRFRITGVTVATA